MLYAAAVYNVNNTFHLIPLYLIPLKNVCSSVCMCFSLEQNVRDKL